MPTRAGWLVLVVGLGIVVAGRVFGVLDLYVLGGGALALGLVAWIRVRLAHPRVEIRRRIEPDLVHAGVPARVDVVVEAEARTPELELWEPVSGHGGASLRVAPLRLGEVVHSAYVLPTDRRGLLQLGPLQITLHDAFGLAYRRLAAAPSAEVLVYPRTVPLPLPALGSSGPLGAALVRHVLARGAGTDFHSQRQYQPGDDLRQVNWRASSRHEHLIVREHAIDASVQLHVLLDVVPDGYDDEGFERAVSAAASIVAAIGRSEHQLDLVVTDGTVVRGGPEAAPRALQALATARPDPVVSLPPAPTAGERLDVNVVVTGRADQHALDRARPVTAGAAARVLVATVAPIPPRRDGWFVVDATTDGSFGPSWTSLVGREPAGAARRWTAPAAVAGARP